MDRLAGLLADEDFGRLCGKIRAERMELEEKLKHLEAQTQSRRALNEDAREKVQQYLSAACSSRELLVSLIERVEVTQDRRMIIRFRFRQPGASA